MGAFVEMKYKSEEMKKKKVLAFQMSIFFFLNVEHSSEIIEEPDGQHREQ